jgi:hypothetical protein
MKWMWAVRDVSELNCFRVDKALKCALRSLFVALYLLGGGTRWRSWLRHCATSRKIAVSIPDYIIGIFHWHPFGHTMALGSTQPEWERRPVRKADNLKTFICRLSWNLGALNSWNPLDLSRPVMGLLYLYLISLDTESSIFFSSLQ